MASANNKSRSILIVAGEASADRYGARLVQRLRALRPDESLTFLGTGGEAMQNAGVRLLTHIRDLAHIGPREAIASFRKYYQTYRRLVASAKQVKPAVAILLDFPDFNLRLAKKMKRMQIPVVYYISPQIWAWRSGRIKAIQKYVDKMLVILPFEEEFYRKHGVEVEFVGHPILEEFMPDYGRDAFLRAYDLDPGIKTIAILPGSRRKEVDYILPILLQASKQLLKTVPAQFIISAAPTVELSHLRQIMNTMLGRGPEAVRFKLVTADARDILANSDFAFVKSGTSTLEAALVGTPFLIAYRLSTLSWCIGNFLIHTPMKGLVNLIAGELIVPEFLQGEATPERLARTALQYLEGPERAEAMKARLAGIRGQLGRRCASEAAAATVNGYL
jgi:lipid-A-disaccharide synthase